MVHRLASLLPLLLAAIIVGVPDPAAAKPDFAHVTTREQAEALVATGALVRIYLFPIRLGGPRRKANISYVPPEAGAALDQISGTLQRFTREGLVDRLEIIPEYRGTSFVPTRINMHATHSGQEGGFHPSIAIW
ncbi:hypothetical protein [Sphingobium yanoikuyae]|uniref:hypothetical protein n=1 Tax=Sphingobium yanoikuyae TaxID=13690 RepID=UPI002FDDE727